MRARYDMQQAINNTFAVERNFGRVSMIRKITFWKMRCTLDHGIVKFGQLKKERYYFSLVPATRRYTSKANAYFCVHNSACKVN